MDTKKYLDKHHEITEQCIGLAKLQLRFYKDPEKALEILDKACLELDATRKEYIKYLTSK